MRYFRLGESRDQISLLPPSIEEYVPRDDSVRFVDALVEEFDLSEIESKYSSLGRPGYLPRMLVKLLLYGKIRGIRASRELARACKENVRFMYLVQNEHPDFRTISDFRKNHIEALGGLLRQTVKIGLAEGVISLRHVAVDGTKVRANASKNSFLSEEKLERLLDALEESLGEDVRGEEEEKQGEGGGDDDGEPKLPSSLQGKEELRKRVREALEKQKAEPHTSRSRTDPDARFMKSKDGKHPSYNGQLAVDADSRMVVGGHITTAGSDHGELKRAIASVVGMCGTPPQQVSADAGYRAAEGLVALEEQGIDGVVALQGTKKDVFSLNDFLYDEENDEYICPAGRFLPCVSERSDGTETYQSENCSGCTLQSDCLRVPGSRRSLKIHPESLVMQQMRERLKQPDAKGVMKERARTVELVIAWLKRHLKLSYLVLRGERKVENLWLFELAAVNCLRLVRYRQLASGSP